MQQYIRRVCRARGGRLSNVVAGVRFTSPVQRHVRRAECAHQQAAFSTLEFVDSARIVSALVAPPFFPHRLRLGDVYYDASLVPAARVACHYGGDPLHRIGDRRTAAHRRCNRDALAHRRDPFEIGRDRRLTRDVHGHVRKHDGITPKLPAHGVSCISPSPSRYPTIGRIVSMIFRRLVTCAWSRSSARPCASTRLAAASRGCAAACASANVRPRADLL